MTSQSAFCSWSGGKDSALALHRALQAGIRVRYLLTMMTEDCERSRSNGVSRRALELQAASLNIPIIMRPTSWEEYESTFQTALGAMRALGMQIGVFGDIDVAAHRGWVERVCRCAALRPFIPLWQWPRRRVMDEHFLLGFRAILVALRAGTIDRKFLGRTIDEDLLTTMQSCSIDLCGENGEYHSFVTMGPDFAFPIPLVPMRPVLHNGYWVLSESPSRRHTASILYPSRSNTNAP